MTDAPAETRSVVVERAFAHPPEKVWRALTQPALIADWLLQNDFEPTPGKSFQLRNQPFGDWDGIIDCKVLAIEPNHLLSYTWDSGEGAFRVTTVVTLTLTPAAGGSHLRMEQTGFGPEQVQNFQGAKYGWRQFLANLEQLLARPD